MRQSRQKDSGFTAAEIMVGVGLLSVLWFVFFAVTDWIYATKENRYRHTWELQQEALRKSNNLLERGPGGFQVTCSPMFEKNCL